MINESLSIEIRIATRKDIDQLTKLHCDSFSPKDHVPRMLGRNYVESMYRWLVDENESYTLVAETKGEIVGVAAVCNGPYTRPMFIACLPSLLRNILARPSLLFRANLWKRLFRQPNGFKSENTKSKYAGYAQMTIGAVDRDHRKNGVFSALIDASRHSAIDCGNDGIYAGVYKSNMSCRQVFVSNGWIEAEDLETHDTVFYYIARADLETLPDTL